MYKRKLLRQKKKFIFYIFIAENHSDIKYIKYYNIMTDKKYKIIDTIPPDAPFGYINWVTISFLTPQKSEKTKFLDVIGFKIHNGYTIEEIANADAKRIKSINKYHDLFSAELGKLYEWDNLAQSENIEYEDSKLNDLEKTRRENAAKLKLMREQFNNEKSNGINPNANSSSNSVRMQEQLKRMRQKLYKEGKITKKELELMQEKNKPLSEIKVEAEEKVRIEAEAEEAFKVDYLDENEPVPLKFGCISIFTPKSVGNLKHPCFKIRGLFQTSEELEARISQLEKLYPDDRIHRFNIGQWTVYSDSTTIDGSQMLKQLNYAMKCHLESIATEKEDFEKRKDTMTTNAENEAKATKIKNRKERKKAKKQAKKPDQDPVPVQTPTSAPTKSIADVASTNHALQDGPDAAAIQNIMDFLRDDELLNKYVTEPQDKSNAMVVEI